MQFVMLPKTQSQWEAAMLIDSAAVGVAAGAYYGEDFDVAGPAPEGIVTAYNKVSEKENRFGLSLFAADISLLAAEMQNPGDGAKRVQIRLHHLARWPYGVETT